MNIFRNTDKFTIGLCNGTYGSPAGTPDGVKCSWNYKVLGYVDINQVAGMYDVISPSTGKPYSNADPNAAAVLFCNEKNNAYNGSFFGS